MSLGRFQDKSDVLGSSRPSSMEIPPGDVRRARLFVASGSTDVGDCAELLEMLGLAFTMGEVAERRAAVDQEQAANTVIQAEEGLS